MLEFFLNFFLFLIDPADENVYDQIGTAVSGQTGIVATAIYDYQAADTDEISFDPGDIIINIEQVSYLKTFTFNWLSLQR